MRAIKNIILPAMLAMAPSRLFAGFNIQSRGTTGSTALQSIVNFFQAIVDLIDGPVAVAVIVLSLFVALAAWNWQPQNSRALGIAARACASGILLLNLGTLVTWLAGL